MTWPEGMQRRPCGEADSKILTAEISSFNQEHVLGMHFSTLAGSLAGSWRVTASG